MYSLGRPKSCGACSLKWNLALNVNNENILTELFRGFLNLGFSGNRICPTQIILLSSFTCLLKCNGCMNISDKGFSERSTDNVIFLGSVSCKQCNCLASSNKTKRDI